MTVINKHHHQDWPELMPTFHPTKHGPSPDHLCFCFYRCCWTHNVLRPYFFLLAFQCDIFQDSEKDNTKDNNDDIHLEITSKEGFLRIWEFWRKTSREHPQMAIPELWNCWHFWQLRTSKHYNHSDLTIKCDIGQHSQFSRCFIVF